MLDPSRSRLYIATCFVLTAMASLSFSSMLELSNKLQYHYVSPGVLICLIIRETHDRLWGGPIISYNSFLGNLKH